MSSAPTMNTLLAPDTRGSLPKLSEEDEAEESFKVYCRPVRARWGGEGKGLGSFVLLHFFNNLKSPALAV
jgi:hypothetical protein